MWRVLCSVIGLCLPVVGWAQEPLQAPTLPESGAGWMDFVIKFLPALWGVLAPVVTVQLQTIFPKLLGRVPRPILGMISGVVGAIAGALTGSLDSLALSAGGITSQVGAVEGATAALVAHKVASSVTPGEPKP